MKISLCGLHFTLLRSMPNAKKLRTLSAAIASWPHRPGGCEGPSNIAFSFNIFIKAWAVKLRRSYWNSQNLKAQKIGKPVNLGGNGRLKWFLDIENLSSAHYFHPKFSPLKVITGIKSYQNPEFLMQGTAWHGVKVPCWTIEETLCNSSVHGRTGPKLHRINDPRNLNRCTKKFPIQSKHHQEEYTCLTLWCTAPSRYTRPNFCQITCGHFHVGCIA